MDPLAPLITALRAEGRLRVWSLVITIMGDVVQPRGGCVPLARLQDLTARLGVEAGALRTALSRLVTDGWLERQRNGRTSQYRLSAKGRGEYGPAAEAIYAAPSAQPNLWTIALMPEGREEGIPLGGGFQLVPGKAPKGAALAVEGGLSLAADAGARFCPPDHLAALSRLADDLDAIAGRIFEPRDAMAARVLLIHHWRRIVLRFGDLPDALLPPHLTALRAKVAAAYGALLPASETWLDSGVGQGLEPLPAADAGLYLRFGERPSADTSL